MHPLILVHPLIVVTKIVKISELKLLVVRTICSCIFPVKLVALIIEPKATNLVLITFLAPLYCVFEYKYFHRARHQ